MREEGGGRLTELRANCDLHHHDDEDDDDDDDGVINTIMLLCEIGICKCVYEGRREKMGRRG